MWRCDTKTYPDLKNASVTILLLHDDQDNNPLVYQVIASDIIDKGTFAPYVPRSTLFSAKGYYVAVTKRQPSVYARGPRFTIVRDEWDVNAVPDFPGQRPRLPPAASPLAVSRTVATPTPRPSPVMAAEGSRNSFAGFIVAAAVGGLVVVALATTVVWRSCARKAATKGVKNGNDTPSNLRTFPRQAIPRMVPGSPRPVSVSLVREMPFSSVSPARPRPVPAQLSR
mmetsp:Transcript_44238/g.72006  ORF Transcript_44238/g.72006 Transcript_44238/m.72006 type:complete len:226 (-) Transcript_44238:126-803(-)